MGLIGKTCNAILLIMIFCIPNHSYAETMSCGAKSHLSRSNYRVIDSRVYLLSKPNRNGEKLVNHKATEALGSIHYMSIDNTVTVKEECYQDGYSRIKVLFPTWLRETHIGWVPSSVLIGK